MDLIERDGTEITEDSIPLALWDLKRRLRDRADRHVATAGMFSELSPVEVRNKRLGVRRPLSGATAWATVPGSIAVVVAAIGGTAFDGASEGALQHPISTVWLRLMGLGLTLAPATRIAETLFMALVIAAVAAIFWIGVVVQAC